MEENCVGGGGCSLEDVDRTKFGVTALAAGTLTMFLSSTTWNEPPTGGLNEKFREPLEGTKRNPATIKIGKTFTVEFVIGNSTVGFATSTGGKASGIL